MTKPRGDFTYCSTAAACPIRDTCARNLELYDSEPDTRIYVAFAWDADTGCEGFVREKRRVFLQSDKK